MPYFIRDYAIVTSQHIFDVIAILSSKAIQQHPASLIQDLGVLEILLRRAHKTEVINNHSGIFVENIEV